MAWREEENALVQDFEFTDFARAMVFVNEVAKLAEAVGHHPDILVHDWNQVKLTLSTHSAGAITDADRSLADRIDKL
jgi:4a-hydroxytetrahydrobiopterin dehydratase